MQALLAVFLKLLRLCSHQFFSYSTLTIFLLWFFHLAVRSFFLEGTWFCYPYFLSGLSDLLNRLRIFNGSFTFTIHSEGLSS